MPINKDAITELAVLWITAGLGCDGDTIAMTSATQPSIEDILFGQIPWIPKVTLHNPFLALALANGDDFLKPERTQRAGRLLGFPGHRPQNGTTDHHV